MCGTLYKSITNITRIINAKFCRKMSKRCKTVCSEEPPRLKGHWTEGLITSMKDTKLIVKQDDKVVVITDKYPKARFHFLVIPREDINSIFNLKRDHYSLLEHMEQVGKSVAQEYKDNEFIIGYHAVPSMQRLHLHVISTDFDSPCLKTKYHWNSFTTTFFLPSESIREELLKNGCISKRSQTEIDDSLGHPLKCHKCSTHLRNMPELKRHLLIHIAD